MRGLAPAYFLTISIAAGSSTAAVFYEGVLILTWLIQEVILNLLFPGACLYVLISLINNLSKEEMLSKMAELLEIAVNWGLKTLLGAAVGLQIVRNLVTPVMDSLKRSALGKTAGAIPVIGKKQSGSCVSDPAGTCGNGACHTLWCFVSFLSFSGSSFPACIR